MKKIIIIFLLFGFYCADAQTTDSISVKVDAVVHNTKSAQSGCPFIKEHSCASDVRSLIIPVVLMGYGIVSLHSAALVDFDKNVRTEVLERFPGFSTKIDNYLQYSPAAAVYVLNLSGIKGKNNYRDITMIYALSTIFSTVAVTVSKHTVSRDRPDWSSHNSFPSGHTATAFAAAEFLRQEYKDVSPWYGVAGYAAAAATGGLRMLNNKHWLSDVIAGAGVGMISTKMAYWVYPVIKKKLFKDKPMNTMVMPYYQPGGGGISLVYNFRR
jgi:hypothetical protein